MISVKEGLLKANKNDLIFEYIKMLPNDTDVKSETQAVSNWLNYVFTLQENRKENNVVVITRYRSDFMDEKDYEYIDTSLFQTKDLEQKVKFPKISEEKIEQMEEEKCDKMIREVSIPQSYAFEFDEWEDVLGYSISQSNIDEYGLETVLAGVIYEMTFFGYKREYMEAEREELERRNQQVEEILKLPEEEQKNHFIGADELIERLKKDMEDSGEDWDIDLNEDEHLYMLHSMLINNIRFANTVIKLQKEIEEAKKNG